MTAFLSDIPKLDTSCWRRINEIVHSVTQRLQCSVESKLAALLGSNRHRVDVQSHKKATQIITKSNIYYMIFLKLVM
ncbi:hypothetical protein SXCC_00869 [Gluconacetobacter sp. SXCC-1]|nr:hypothetical protein SXCC_00869 [Gluconacetobacter sp. SXCC-1]